MREQERQGAALQLLSFRLGGEDFAVEVGKTREILELNTLTRLPQMPAAILGVINLRGGVVPVVDLRHLLGLPAATPNQGRCIIVLEVAVAGTTMVVGALADTASEVLELPAEAIEAPPRLGLRMSGDFLSGIGKHAEQFLLLLDIDRIFAAIGDTELRQLAAA